MSRVEPVDPRVRLAITQWPPDAPAGSGDDILSGARDRAGNGLCDPKTGVGGWAGCGVGTTLEATEAEPRDAQRRGGPAGDRGAGLVGAIRAGSRPDQCPREDALAQDGAGAVHGVAGTDLPRRGRRPSGTAEEAAGLLPTVRLSRPERVLAARRARIRPDRRSQVRDPPAHRRPLPARGRLARRLG